ncbi:MAG: hypothetical protein F4Z57_12240 [Gemmatimonadetes bacterium]|nr:hypothetical protein [Gemmatimonadota bacterium]
MKTKTKEVLKSGRIEVVASFKGRQVLENPPPLFPHLLASSLSKEDRRLYHPAIWDVEDEEEPEQDLA